MARQVTKAASLTILAMGCLALGSCSLFEMPPEYDETPVYERPDISALVALRVPPPYVQPVRICTKDVNGNPVVFCRVFVLEFQDSRDRLKMADDRGAPSRITVQTYDIDGEPLHLCTHELNPDDIRRLREAGLDYVGPPAEILLPECNPEILDSPAVSAVVTMRVWVQNLDGSQGDDWARAPRAHTEYLPCR